MSLQYTAKPSDWIRVPQGADASTQNPEWLASALSEAEAGADEADDRLVLLDPARERAFIIDLDVLDLGDDVPDPVGLEDGSTVTTEEFTAGEVRGKRTVWVSPAPEGSGTGEDALQAQALFVGTLQGTGFLLTLRTGLLPLDAVVDVLARCEELLATVHGG